MANQTIGVNLKFSADVSAAKRAMAELQGSLAQIHNAAVTSANPGIRYAKDLNQASQAAAQLRIQLQNAFNQDTGKLNLTKFNMEMKQAGMSVEKYRAALTSIGPQGQQAFTQLAHSVAMAETNTINLSAGIQRLGTTFMNTLRYQLSSTVIMGFVQGISEAVTYVKDLNASLNDIRIVTNYGVDEMKEFANYANKAAKALSTTTNEYAKASLIYFQQGLTDEEVQKRTDLTIKMANVTGQAVGEVSDQLTSVWNNFDNGTKSLEHYVDVMVALGAATASSSEEISEGLNKFAAVAETVGLSYEYAAAALATVTATTRQSADIVGTAFKTLFARIQDLELGKELDDGTTLGQYSQALAAVGISIKDVNGEVKDMNSILDEMGAKWNTLSKDSQIALAQNVAGVRQYTQLIALMDNWDFFKQNLETANASTGSLQEQADIYAESWEAASQRVTASLETIYNKLLNDEFFIDATNLLADFIGLVENLIDGLGGMPGVLALIGVALTRVFSTQMAQGINNMAYNIRSMTKAGKAENAKMQQDFANAAAKEYGTTGASGQQGVIAKEEARLQEIYIRNKGKMSELEKQVLETRMAELKIQKQQVNSEIEQTKTLEKQVQVQKRVSQNIMSSRTALKRREGFDDERIEQAERSGNRYLGTRWVPGQKDTSGYQRGFMYMTEQESNRAFADLKYSTSAQQINTALDIQGEDTFKPLSEGTTASYDQQSKAIEELQSRLKALGVTKDTVDAQMKDEVGDELSSKYQNLAAATDAAQQAIEEYNAAVARGDSNQDKYKQAIDEAVAAVQKEEQALQGAANSMRKESQEAITLAGGTDEATQATIDLGVASGQNKIKIMELGQQYDKTGKNAEKSAIRILDFGTAMQQSAMMISTLTMVVTSLIGLFKTLSDEEIDPSEKITTVLTTLGFMLPMVIGLFNEQSKSLYKTIGAYFLTAGGANKATLEIYKSGDAAAVSGIKAELSAKKWLGFWKTLGKFAIYAAAIAVVVLAVTALAKAADDARNSAENFAASAAQGAKDAAEAYSQATTAFNELKDSIESYENALTGLQKLTQGTNEYKQALFDANEQALALVQSHAGLKYYIDSNGLIVFEEGELDRIELEAQQKKADAYSAKLAADKVAREANIDYQKIQLGRKLKGQDYEWNAEDSAARSTGAAIGAGVAGTAGILSGAAIGAKFFGGLGTFAGPVGTAVGAAAGLVLGGIVGAIFGDIASIFDNDATKEEQKAMDALYEAYKEQGDAALTEKGIRDALSEVGIDDENLILSLAENKDATEDLMKAMEANTAAIEAETRSAAIQQAHALDNLLQYKDSESQAAITEAMTRMRTQGAEKYDFDQNSYRDKGLFGWWYNANQTGKDAFNEWATAQGLTKKNVKATNYSDNYIEYEYIDDDGQTQKKKLQYSQLAAWQESQAIDEYAESAYDSIKKAVETAQDLRNNEGLMSIVGGQNLMTLSEKEIEEFKKVIDTAEYKDYIKNNWKVLGYESEQAFTKVISEGIANYNPEEAFARFSKTLNAEIDGILSAGAEETEYTAGALENYTDALAENNEALHDNADAWSNLEKKKFAAQAAVANAKFVKGVDALTEVLEDNLEILIEWNEASLDTYEAADKVQTALEDVFGVRVSADFIKNNLTDIQALAQGSTENIEELSRAAAIDFALNIDTMSEETKGNFVAMLNQLADIAANKTIEIGTDINNDEYIAQLNQMLEAGEITAEQIQQSFGALGYSPDIKFKTVEQKTRTTHYIYEPGQPDKTVVSETVSDVQVPYIAGENTFEPAAEDGSDSGQEKGKGITKVRDVGSIGASLGDTKKEKDDKIKELDRYHEIKEELADIERGLNKIAKAKDRAFGKAKLDLIGQEIKQQEKLNAAEQKYLEEIQKYYKKDLENLDSRFELDENGRIKNYTDVLQGLINSGITGDAYEEIKKSADQYEETLNELEAQQEVINEGILTLKDLALEKIEYEVEINVHFNDREIKRLEHLLKNLEDPAQDAAKAIALLGRTAERNLKNVDTYIKGIKDILGESFSEEQKIAFKNLLNDMPSEEDLPNALRSILGEDTQITDKQKTALEKYIDSLYQSSDAMDEFYDSIMEKVNGAFEDMGEKAEKAINRTEQLGATLKAYQNIIDLVGKKALGVTDAQIRMLGRAQIAQAKSNLELKQNQLEMNRSALVSAEAQYKTAKVAGDTEAMEHWSEQIEIIRESVWELEADVESTWGDTLQTIADDFANAVETSTSAFEEAMTGIYGSYDKLQEVFNQQKEIGNRFVDDYQKIYNLNKLNRDLTNSIDDTNSIKGKQALRDLQKEINKLQESDTELSQHDLDFLRKKYELRLAEIALEEAQNAKSQVRMRRDSEGNWGYVYTADQDNIAKAQQSFEDKLYEIQDLEQNYIDEMQERVIQAEVDMIEAINALRVEDFSTQEEYQAEVTRITEYYTGMRNYALDELNRAIENSKTIYQNDWLAYSEKTGYKISKEANWRQAFKDTEIAMITGYDTIEKSRSAFELNMTTMVDTLIDAFGQWEIDVRDTFDIVEQEFDNFGGENGTLNKKVKNITRKLNEIDEKFKGWKDIATTGFKGITEAATEQFNNFSSKITQYKDEINRVTAALTAMLDLAGMEIPAPKVELETEGAQSGGTGGDGHGGIGPGDNDGKKYYGTYYDPLSNKSRHTTKTFKTEEEAKQGAIAEARLYAEKVINESQYQQSKNLIGPYANYSIDSLTKLMTSDGKIGAEKEGLIKTGNLIDFDSIGGYNNLFGIKDIQGATKWIRQNGYNIDLYKDNIKLNIKGDGIEGTTYINKETLYEIARKFGEDNISEEVIKLYGYPTGEQNMSLEYNSPAYTQNSQGNIEYAGRRFEASEYFFNLPITTKKIERQDGGMFVYYQHPIKKDLWILEDYLSFSNANKFTLLPSGTKTSNHLITPNNKYIHTAFDTGGYTGVWGPEGRMAMLHQKEIVLNAHDTENFLSAINIVRDIASLIDLRAAAQQSALSMMSATSIAPTTQTLQQEVTIHAEFPNATQRTEIEAAFDTLLNRASQFANRKNK